MVQIHLNLTSSFTSILPQTYFNLLFNNASNFPNKTHLKPSPNFLQTSSRIPSPSPSSLSLNLLRLSSPSTSLPSHNFNQQFPTRINKASSSPLITIEIDTQQFSQVSQDNNKRTKKQKTFVLLLLRSSPPSPRSICVAIYFHGISSFKLITICLGRGERKTFTSLLAAVCFLSQKESAFVAATRCRVSSKDVSLCDSMASITMSYCCRGSCYGGCYCYLRRSCEVKTQLHDGFPLELPRLLL
jgi:hypothetical protein